MKHGKKWLPALLVAALAASLCLPLALADDPAEVNGLVIEYDPVAPEADDGEHDGDEEAVLDAVVPESDGEGLEGTGLTVDGGATDECAGDPDEGDGPSMPGLPEREEQVFCLEGGLDETAAAAGFINRAMYRLPTRGPANSRANFAGSRLEGADLRLYNALRPLVLEVAEGARASAWFEIPVRDIYDDVSFTASELGLESLYADGQPSSAAVYAFWDRITPNIAKVMRALMSDYPYEMFWFDKTRGVRWLYAGYTFDGDAIRVSNYRTDKVYYKFTVCAAYSEDQATGTFETDRTRIASVQTAANNAARIRDDAARVGSDYDKLAYYRDRICGSVSYDYDAISGNADYGDPWQLVYVFDGDDSTNVVCEGYSKAFQYLCDMTDFANGSIYVLSVTGNMYNDHDVGGRHMWNLVNVDGVKYLVDVTNCDAHSAAAPDLLFMKGYSDVEQTDAGPTYYFQLPSVTLRYTFDDGVIDLFGKDEVRMSDNPVGQNGVFTDIGNGDLAWCMSGDGTLYIRGSGAIPDYDADDAPWKGDGLRRVALSNGVTAVGAKAFAGCPNLEQVTIPPSVEAIAQDAFDGYPALRGKCKGFIIQSCASKAVIEYCQATQINYSVRHGQTVSLDAVAPTCTSTGLTAGGKCSVCGCEITPQEIVPALGHRPTVVAATAPTCTKTGLTDGTKCATCDAWITAQKTVAATGHSWQTVKGYAATCTQAGLTDGTKCATCGAWQTPQRTIAAKGHRAVTVKGYAATCTQAGLTDGTKCAACGAILTAQRSIPAKGHSAQTVKGYAATCTQAGLTDGTKCAACGAILTVQRSIPAKGHSSVTVKGYTATCTRAGLTDGTKCAACGAILTAQRNIPAKGHSPVRVAGCSATYTATGLTDGSYCAVCGDWLTPQQVIPQVYIRQIPLDRAKNNGTVTMLKGENAMLVPRFAGDHAVTGYSSARASAASVDGAGILTATGEGKARITVTTDDRKVKATITIHVVDPYKPTGVSIAQGRAITVPVGTAFHLDASLAPEGAQAALTWSSSRAAVASVDGSGWVMPLKEGRARITVRTHNRKKASITVTVVDPYKPTGVSIAQGKAVRIRVGQALHLDARLAPTDARTTLTWKTSRPGVASVDGSGWVAGLKKGVARITVTTANRKKATITVIVEE